MIRKLLALIKHRGTVRTAVSSALRIAEGDENAAILGGLTEEEIQGLIGWLPEEGLFVEFGTLFGLTAKRIAAAKPKLKIVCVDNFSWNPFGLPPDLHEQFTRRILFNEIQSGQIELFRGTSAEYRARLARSLRTSDSSSTPTAVFFDALHQYEPVKEEIRWAKSVGVKCICGHDYNNPSPVFGVTRAVNEEFSSVSLAGMCWLGR